MNETELNEILNDTENELIKKDITFNIDNLENFDNFDNSDLSEYIH